MNTHLGTVLVHDFQVGDAATQLQGLERCVEVLFTAVNPCKGMTALALMGVTAVALREGWLLDGAAASAWRENRVATRASVRKR